MFRTTAHECTFGLACEVRVQLTAGGSAVATVVHTQDRDDHADEPSEPDLGLDATIQVRHAIMSICRRSSCKHASEQSGALRGTFPLYDCLPAAERLQERQQAAMKHALQENKRLQAQLQGGQHSLEKASQRIAILRASIESLKLRYKGEGAIFLMAFFEHATCCWR